jgi:hypothetical protein
MKGSPLRKRRRASGLHKPRKRLRDNSSKVPVHPAVAAALEAKFDREMIRRIKKLDAQAGLQGTEVDEAKEIQ